MSTETVESTAASPADKIDECNGCGLAVCDVPLPPEPPDGSRIEFEHCTDVFAAWRDDQGSALTGWTSGDGGEVWCEYGRVVPVMWSKLGEDFGPCVLALAVRLVPVAEDLPKRELWPTQVYARQAIEAGELEPGCGKTSALVSPESETTKEITNV